MATEYIVLSADTIASLKHKVDNHLALGWTVQGNMVMDKFAWPYETIATKFYQTMIK